MILAAISIEIISGFGGAFIGSISSYLLIKGSEKKKLTLEFHKEWNNNEMSHIRRSADVCITKLPNATYKDLRDLDEEGSIHVYTVMRFFQRIWKCIKSGNMNHGFASELFADAFLYWYCLSYEKNLIPLENQFEVAKDIAEMHKWISLNTSFEEYERLTKKYWLQYEERIKGSSSVKATMSDNILTSEIKVDLAGKYIGVSKVSVTHAISSTSLTVFEQLRVVQMKEEGLTDSQIFEKFDKENIIQTADTNRIDLLKTYLGIIEGDRKDYYKKLKNILLERGKTQIRYE